MQYYKDDDDDDNDDDSDDDDDDDDDDDGPASHRMRETIFLHLVFWQALGLSDCRAV